LNIIHNQNIFTVNLDMLFLDKSLLSSIIRL